MLRSNTLSESTTHSQVAEGIAKVINDLTQFRDNKERIRRRVKEDLTRTKEEHEQYRSTVQRLRKNYEKRVEEVQNHEESEREREESVFPPEHWASASEGSSNPIGINSNKSTRERTGSTASSRGVSTDDPSSPPFLAATSPPNQPVFVSGASSSNHSQFRDPPTTKQSGNVFDAIAKRDWSGEKHRINSLARVVGNLAKGNDSNSNNSGNNSSNAHHHNGKKGFENRGTKARTISGKLKREAEQADRDYRDGVFRLETLRLQRLRIQNSSQQFLREYAIELTNVLRQICFSVPSLAKAMVSVADLMNEIVADGLDLYRSEVMILVVDICWIQWRMVNSLREL